MLILAINAIIYILWFYVTYKKERTITIYSFLIGLITIVSILGWYTVVSGIWFNVFGHYNINEISPIPYILTFFTFVVFFSPLRGIGKIIQLRNKVFESSTFKYFLLFWLFLISAYTFVRFSEMTIALEIGLDEVYQDRHVDGNDLLFLQHANPVIAKIVWIGGMVSNATSPLMMFYSIYLFIIRKKIILPLIILILSTLPAIIVSIAIGSRGAMVWALFKVVFIFILSKDLVDKSIKRLFLTTVSIFFTIVLVYSAITTIGRLEGSRSETASSSVLRYFGEPFPNAGMLYWDNVKKHPMGKRFFPDYTGFKKDIGTSSDEKFEYWTSVTGVPILNWKILYIDCYIEFGIFGGFLFLLVIGSIFNLYLRKKKVNLYNITIIYAYFEMCNSTFTGYNMQSERLTVVVVSLLITNLMLFFIDKTTLTKSNYYAN